MKRLAGLLSGLSFTHVCTHAHISIHGEAASTQGLAAGDGSTVEPHRLHSATATPFSTGTPLSRVTLYTHSQHDSGPSTTHRKQSCVLLHNHAHSLLDTPLSCNDTTRRSWCRCDAQHTHGTRLWLAGEGASWRDRAGFRVAVWRSRCSPAAMREV